MKEVTPDVCMKYMNEFADFHGYPRAKQVKEYIINLIKEKEEKDMSEANEMCEWFESVIEDMIKEYKTLSYYDTEALRKQGAIQALEELLRRLNE